MVETGSHEENGQPDELARAAAAGPPLDWDDEDGNDNLEAGEAHDSPAAIDEERAAAGGDRPDAMFSIYREPAEQLREERRD
jgi:hypothetical protein